MPRCKAKWAANCTHWRCKRPSRRNRKIFAESEGRKGIGAALFAYVIWGVFALYYRQLSSVSAIEVLCHRIVWSALFCLLLLALRGKLVELLRTLTDRKLMLGLAASGFCVSINWGGYIWAIQAGHALDSSLAYYILPLVNLGLGVLILREKLSLRQGLSIIGVVLAVVLLTIDRGQLPWIVLLLPASFGLYGLLRKMVAVDAMIGVTVETLLVAPLAIVYLVMQPDGGALTQDSWTIKTLLVLCGPMTTIPLILFTYGARRMKLSSLGLLQYINPTIQMFVAAFVLGEPIHRLQMFAFLLIWGGLVVYSWPSRTTPQPAG